MCDSAYAQDLVRQGYRYLDASRFNDARLAAGQLASYAKSCSDPKVQYPSVVYSAYIGSAALHGLGQDQRAAKTLQMGMVVLEALKSEGNYSGLYSAMEPKFSDLARQIKPPSASPAPGAAAAASQA
ncbi:MAG TPA: hypothetical protein VN860_06350, partial [Candidatus Acidoferrales bacterium]|nr:hypothetical protein [Candidatus Acidoferrales bacterium]